jgi:r-opsin
MNNKSHIMACFATIYVCKVAITIGCYYFIVQAIFKHEDGLRQQVKKMNVTSLRTNTDQQSISAEIRIAKIAIMNVSLWLLSWTPFAVVSLIGTWGDTSLITPLICDF